jgi:hypothetical protein
MKYKYLIILLKFLLHTQNQTWKFGNFRIFLINFFFNLLIFGGTKPNLKNIYNYSFQHERPRYVTMKFLGFLLLAMELV